MKKLCSLFLFLLALTGCQQKKELSDVELVKIAREYMSVMNPGKVDKSPASVNSWHDYSDVKYYSWIKCRYTWKYEWTDFKEVKFFNAIDLVRWEEWRVRIEDGKTVRDVLMNPEELENERKERKLPIQQQKNCWGNYMWWQEWMK
jgi:hypothetical protein